jgi:hypothetical protein
MQDFKISIQSMRQAVETLSGGRRQGVAVARSAAFARRVVIMDEPTAALGVKEFHMVLDLIRKVRDRGLPVILISHNMPHVFEVADRVHIQRLGRRIAVINPHDFLGELAGRRDLARRQTLLVLRELALPEQAVAVLRRRADELGGLFGACGVTLVPLDGAQAATVLVRACDPEASPPPRAWPPPTRPSTDPGHDPGARPAVAASCIDHEGC